MGFSARGGLSSSSEAIVIVGETRKGFEGESRIKRVVLRGGVDIAGEGVIGGRGAAWGLRCGVLGATGKIEVLAVVVDRRETGGETGVYTAAASLASPTPQKLSSLVFGSSIRRLFALGCSMCSSSSDVDSRTVALALTLRVPALPFRRCLFLCVVLGGVGNEARLAADALLFSALGRGGDIEAVFIGEFVMLADASKALAAVDCLVVRGIRCMLDFAGGFWGETRGRETRTISGTESSHSFLAAFGLGCGYISTAYDLDRF